MTCLASELLYTVYDLLHRVCMYGSVGVAKMRKVSDVPRNSLDDALHHFIITW